MTYILNIETSTTVCSVSLALDGELVVYREINDGFTHAENLHLFIQALMAEANITVQQLGAIAVSKGPGSYTGLRIGVSAAKGLAYALRLPLIAIDTLRVITNHQSVIKNKNEFYCPMIDARRMEVYCGLFDSGLAQQMPTEALIVDNHSIQKFRAWEKVHFFGDGMAKCATVLQELPNASFIENVIPSAQYMCSLSFEKFLSKTFEDLAYFEPFYLKDFFLIKK
ncbi:MAG: tRNA (adenosine(37)-N6)-threonylcarbamoyltransferase complex dimerization subunit type 1 TsaB [Bacteroidota bacterium]